MAAVRPTRLRRLANPALALVLALSAIVGAGLAALPRLARAADAAPPPRLVMLRVKLDADGKVLDASSLDASAVPALVQAGQEIARKLPFTPARKQGRPVASETNLLLSLAFVPRAAGGYGISLARAQNGPSITARKSQGTFGGVHSGHVVVGADLAPDGSIEMASFGPATADADPKLVKAAHDGLLGSVFQLDTVDGIAIPARITFDFDFASKEPPALSAVSKIEGVELPKVDFRK
jgi:hypothetical protein